MSKHTPGPWKLCMHSASLGGAHILGTDACSIVDVIEGTENLSTGYKVSHETMKANAQLISLAPAMFDLLLDFEILLRVNAQLWDGSEMHKQVLRVLNKLGFKP